MSVAHKSILVPFRTALKSRTFLISGLLKPRDRLSLIRTQEENLSIARELERTLARKCEQRKLRLEQEEMPSGNVEKGIGTFEVGVWFDLFVRMGFDLSVKIHKFLYCNRAI